MRNYAKVYKELYEIFKYLPQELFDKIPTKLIKKIEKKMDKSYEYKVTHIADFRNQNMMKETKAILAVLYRDYWASEEERKQIIAKEYEENKI